MSWRANYGGEAIPATVPPGKGVRDEETTKARPARVHFAGGSFEDAMGLWRESAAYRREEEAECIGELIGAGYAEDRGQMTPERRAYPLELFRLEVVRGDYGFYSSSASSSAALSSAGLTRPLCLKTSAPERS